MTSTTSSCASASASSSSSPLPVNVVGAGLAGCMAALLLSKCSNNTLPIRVFEYRGDIRHAETTYKDDVVGHLGKLVESSKRSVNLALSYRGICALKAAGLFDAVQDKLIPMRGRYMHDTQGNITFQAYGTGDQAIYSVSRPDLNMLLLDELEKLPNITLRFNTKISRVDNAGVVYSGDTAYPAQFTIGADGAYSTLRDSMRRSMRMDFSMEYISCGYKELHIPPTASGDYALPDWQGLHIWPRHEFMLIALPNPDHSFTVTLFAPFAGETGFDYLTTDARIMEYFQTYYPDVIPVAPTLLQDYKESPASALITVRCRPWSYKNKVVLIGDAAHAVVPFYGQGMNAAFEDCLLFSELYTEHHGQVAATISAFCDQRTDAGHALADLSLANFIEMRDKTADRWFLYKKKFEKWIHSVWPTYLPLYTMVAFTRIPYHECRKRAEKQERWLHGAGIAVGVSTVLLSAATVYLTWQRYARTQR